MKNRILKNKICCLMVVLALVLTAICGTLPLWNGLDAHAEEVSNNIYYVAADAPVDLSLGEPNNRNKPYDITRLLSSNEILKPGDTVKIIPGDYNLVTCITIRVSGTYNHYITIENDSDTEQATLKFYGQEFNSLNRGIQMYGSYIYWRDVDVCGAGDNGLYIGGSYNIVEDCEFYNNRDTGLQLGRAGGDLNKIDEWPSYNLVKNCTSHNNYDNETYGENADGFAAKLTVGYGNVFDGCIAYRNSDDGWDLYAKTDSGNIGAVIIYNCVAFENGFIEYNQETCNAMFPAYRNSYDEAVTTNFDTRDGDGNGFKLGGSVMEGDVVMYNCLSFNNRMHGVTDNSNPGVISLTGITSYDNGRKIDNNVSSATYGQVLQTTDDACGNIDMARQTYSYNNLDRVLSVKSASAGVTADAYRASVQNSILGTASGNSKAYKIEGKLDANTKIGANGKEISAPVAKDVFEMIPVDFATSTYNFSGLKDMDNGTNRIHYSCRNADGSINMHGLLAVKDYSKLLGENNKIGSVLNLTSYDAYTHFDLTNNYSGVESETAAILKAAKETLTVSCNTNAVYQDFWAATNMKNVSISWASSDPSVLEVSETTKTANASRASFVYLVVHRDYTKDQDVTLTATITANGESVTKQFALHVMQDQPRIGDIFVTASNGEKVYNGSSVIVDHYAVALEPTIAVVNGANYSGLEFVEGSQYTVDTTYEYATSKLSNFVEVKEFTPSNAGVWHISHKVTLISSQEVKTFNYYIYTASPAASVEFVGDPVVSVNLYGFLVSGQLSNVTGIIYAVSSSTPIEVTAENIKTLDGVESYTFCDDSISYQFTNENNAGYYVYFAIANMRNEITSRVYQDQISLVEVGTTDAFVKLAGGKQIGSETISKTIYVLTKCLDFSGKSYKPGSDPFTGFLNGNGHTVSNITVNGAGVITKFEGGTITNIKFNNIDINNGENQRTGIVSTAYGGYFNGIEITNINITGGQRSGGLIGQIYQGNIPTYISSVSVVNPIPTLNDLGEVASEGKTYTITANGNRAGGLVGFIQPSNSDIKNNVEVYIANCYSESYILATGYSVGGIVGEYDDTYAASIEAKFVLEIRNCYTKSILVGTGSSSRIGGMLGYQHGGGDLKVIGCLSMMQAYFKNLYVDVAQKNISGIIGGFASTGNIAVAQCASLFDEYNTDFGVTAYTISALTGEYGLDILSGILKFNSDAWEFQYKAGSTTELQEPLLVLKLSKCSCK